MEIAPIAGIRVMAQPEARPADPELMALFDMEAPARPGDDTYTGSRRKAAGAEEPDAEPDPADEAIDDPADETLVGDSPAEPAVARKGHQPDENPQAPISFFA